MLTLDPNKIVALEDSLIQAGYRYGLGAKMNPLSDQATDVPVGIRTIDCSGCSRWLVFHGLGQPEDFHMPDGSVNQHEWAKQNFKEMPREAALRHDNCVYAFFLAPEDTHDGIGHTGLCVNGVTQESHGGKGPDHREWLDPKCNWMQLCTVYQISIPA